jgi:basic membrane protein A
MHRNIMMALSLLLLMISPLTGCNDSKNIPATDAGGIRIGLVTDTVGISDRSFNATVWKGVQDAQRDLGIHGAYLEPLSRTDYERNIKVFTDKNYELVITVGFMQADATKAAAAANPDRKFAIVDSSYNPVLPNVMGLTFNTDEAAFLAGYLAAGMSRTGKVGTFGGMTIPPVTIFMVGFEKGVHHYNQQFGKKVEVIGWKTDPGISGCGTGRFTGNFDNSDDGRIFANRLMDDGADIVVPVAGLAGSATAAAVKARGMMMIGVDSDQYVSAPQYSDVYLTSIVKNSDNATYDVIKTLVDNSFKGGTYLGTLKNGGVGIAPYHDFDTRIPAGLKTGIEQLKKDIIDGKVSTGWSDCLK